MKFYRFLFLLILFGNSFILFAQTTDIAVDSIDVDAYDVMEPVEFPDFASEDGYYAIPEEDLQKYNFEKGKPVFIVVNIQHSNPNDSLLAVRELKELQKNFKEMNAKFVGIHNNSVVKFENKAKEEYRFDNYNEQYQSVVFWDGKAGSDVYEFKSIIQASEAYSPQLNLNKTSSYADEFFKKKEELWKFKNETINQNSKAVSQKYISNLFLSNVYNLKNDEHFFSADFKGVKRLTVKSNYKKFKNPVNEAEFDKDGNPTKLILQSDDSDGKKINIEFSYLSGALKKMVSKFSDEDGMYSSTDEYFYQDGTMFENSDEDSFNKYHINENGFLLSHSYYFDENRFFNIEDELSFKGKMLSYRDYGNLNNLDYTINSLQDYFPVKVKLREDLFYEIKKISQNEFSITSDYSTTKVLLNEKGKISKVIMENLELEGESKAKDLIFEYFYEYY